MCQCQGSESTASYRARLVILLGIRWLPSVQAHTRGRNAAACNTDCCGSHTPPIFFSIPFAAVEFLLVHLTCHFAAAPCIIIWCANVFCSIAAHTLNS